MKQGFLLLDVLLAVTLSVVLVTSLYQCLYQTTVLTHRAESAVDYGTALTIFCNQIEKDFSAAFVAIQEQDAQKPQQQLTAQGLQTKPRDEKKVEPEKKAEDTKQFFVKKNARGATERMSCISTTRLAVYGQELPAVARIVYALEKTQTKGIFKLMRQEATTLDLAAFDDTKKIHAYALIDTLKKFTVRCIVYTLDPKDEKAAPKKETFDVWNEEIQQKTQRKIPDYIEVEGVYWDELLKKEYDFTLLIPVFAKEKTSSKNEQAPQPANQMQRPALPQAPQLIMGAV